MSARMEQSLVSMYMQKEKHTRSRTPMLTFDVRTSFSFLGWAFVSDLVAG